MDDQHLQWELGTVAGTTFLNGFMGIQTTPLGDGGTMQMMPAYNPAGFLSRPRDPDTLSGDVTSAANCLIAWEGSRGHALALGDPRATAKLPQVKRGGAIVYSDPTTGSPSFQSLDGDDGSYTLYVPYGDTSMAITVDVSTAGAENIQIRHGAGMGISMVAGGLNSLILNNSKGDAYIEVNDDGITLNGKVTHVGNLDAGVPGPTELPVPPDAVVLGTGFQIWATALTVAGAALVPPLVVTPFVPVGGLSTKFKAA